MNGDRYIVIESNGGDAFDPDPTWYPTRIAALEALHPRFGTVYVVTADGQVRVDAEVPTS